MTFCSASSSGSTNSTTRPLSTSIRWSWCASGAAVAEVVPVEDAGFLEQAHRAVDRGDRDLRIDRGGARVQRLDVGMILGLGQDPRDHAALLGDPEAPLGAERFKIDRLVQGGSRQEEKSARPLWKRPDAFSTACAGLDPVYAAAFLRRPRFWPGLRPRPICLASTRRFSA